MVHIEGEERWAKEWGIDSVTTQYHTIPCHTTPHHATPDHTTPHQTTPHHATPHHTTPHLYVGPPEKDVVSPLALQLAVLLRLGVHELLVVVVTATTTATAAAAP